MVQWEMGCGGQRKFASGTRSCLVAGDIEVPILGSIMLRVMAVHYTTLIGNVRMDVEGICRSLCSVRTP